MKQQNKHTNNIVNICLLFIGIIFMYFIPSNEILFIGVGFLVQSLLNLVFNNIPNNS